jgi:hypothetical protein
LDQNLPLSELSEKLYRLGRCSAIVKLTPGNGELFTAHNTWYLYGAMLRVLKQYHYITPENERLTISCSSFAGMLSSSDDFYVLSNKLTITETTDEALTKEIYRHITAEGVPSWIMSMATSLVAKNGREWAELMGRNSTGTCTNEWMVVDYNKFHRNSPILPETLMVVSTFQNGSIFWDASDYLENNSYFASYNSPRNTTVFEVMGFSAAVTAIYVGLWRRRGSLAAFPGGYDSIMVSPFFLGIAQRQENVATFS